jgi:hypothetical protein
MATVGETSRPGYVYDSATDVWIPVGIGPHSHTPAAIGAVSSSVVTAKGDLIVATSSGVVTNKSVGTDGTYLVADSTQTTGVNWAGPSTMAGRNAVLNSNMSVWQRGTSITLNTTTYAADRWQGYRGNSGSTVSRQATGDTTNLPNIQYCARVQRNSGTSGTEAIYLAQSFESINSIPLAGKTVTFSFYARKGANYSQTSSVLNFPVYGAATTDANVLTSMSGTQILNIAATLTTTWQRFTATATVSASYTQIGMYAEFLPTGTAGAADYYDITGVQLEVGSVATPYAPNGATYQAELAACQRYYYRNFPAAAAYSIFSVAQAASTTVAYASVSFPVPMRTNPSAVEVTSTAANYAVTSAAFGYIACSVLPSLAGITNTQAQLGLTVASGLVAGNATFFISNNSTAAYVGFSAEL